MGQFLRRTLDMMTGLILYALGIVLTINAKVGLAPWDVFHDGLSKKTIFSFGVASIIAGLVIVVIVTVLGEKLGIGTIASMILTGVFIDIIMFLDFMPQAPNLLIGYAMLIIGFFIIALGTYFYIKSAFGVGPRDNLMVVLARKTKLPVGICRFAVELIVTVIGWLLGGMVGIGTIISVFAIGFCVQIIFMIFKFDVTAIQHENVSDTLNFFLKNKKR